MNIGIHTAGETRATKAYLSVELVVAEVDAGTVNQPWDVLKH